MKAFLNWSGGKDSAYCLFKARQEGIPPYALVTSVNQAKDRISMHGVRRSLLQQQAAAVQLPLHTIEQAEQPSMQAYEAVIHHYNKKLKAEGFTHAMSGDLFLEDLKQYREQLYAKDDIECTFPLWKVDTQTMLKDFIELGFKAVIVCVNSLYLDASFCGRLMDESFLADLPAGVDPCGEKGEYHSFVYDGPGFIKPVQFQKGDLIYQEYPAPKTSTDCFREPQAPAGFYFLDLEG